MMTIELEYKSYPENKPSESGRYLCLAYSSIGFVIELAVWSYNTKYDAFGVTDDSYEELAKFFSTDSHVIGFFDKNLDDVKKELEDE